MELPQAVLYSNFFGSIEWENHSIAFKLRNDPFSTASKEEELPELFELETKDDLIKSMDFNEIHTPTG